MSKGLAKFLLICSVVVVLPLFVAGTVLAVAGAKTSTILLSIFSEGTAVGVDAPKIDIEGGNVEEITTDNKISYRLTIGENRDIKISFNGVGYKFDGWYEGTAFDKANAEYFSTNKTVTIKVTEHTNIVAVAHAIEYKGVSYSYQTDPADENTATVEAPNGKSTFMYGEELPILSDTEDYNFVGWRISGDSTAKVYTTATFGDVEDITLNAVWNEKWTVVYMDGETELKTERFVKAKFADYQLIDANTYSVAGYRAGWFYNENQIAFITEEMINSAENNRITLTLKKEAINYTANVSSDEGQFAGNSSITFNVENIADLTDIFNASNWTHKYNNLFAFTGVQYNNQSYNLSDATAEELAQALAESIIEENPTNSYTATLVANFECRIKTLYVNGIRYADTNNSSVYNANGDSIAEMTGDAYEVVIDEEALITSTYQDTSKHGLLYYIYTEYYDSDANLVNIYSLTITVNSIATVYYISDLEDLSLYAFLEKIIDENALDVSSLNGTFTLSNMKVTFA